MSRIGKKPIIIPPGVEVEIKEQELQAKGPKGQLSLKIPFQIKIKQEEKEGKKQILIDRADDSKKTRSFHGLFRNLINNMIEGVNQGFKKQLEIQGLGFRASLETTEQGKQKLVLLIGFSHPVSVSAPEGISFSVAKNIITVEGIDKQLVGEMAAKIRAKKVPEPYKGKGIRYLGEIVKRKPGKAVVKMPGAT